MQGKNKANRAVESLPDSMQPVAMELDWHSIPL
jgi:hypothetical protein